MGLVAALLGPLTGLLGTLVALGVAVALALRGQRRPAALVVLAALVAVALAYALLSPVGRADPVLVLGAAAPP